MPKQDEVPEKTDPAASAPAPTTPPAGGNPHQTQGANSGFSQDELDRRFSERAQRAQEAERKRLLENLGVKDEDELKSIVQAKRDSEERAKSELQKLADQALKAEERAKRIEAEAERKIAEMNKRLLDGEIKRLASQPVKDKDGKILRPAFRQDALDDLLILLDRAGISDDEGKYSGIDKALAEFAKTRPHFLDGKQAEPKGTPLPEKKSPQQKDDTTRPMLIQSL
jgi:hypothetical protein